MLCERRRWEHFWDYEKLSSEAATLGAREEAPRETQGKPSLQASAGCRGWGIRTQNPGRVELPVSKPDINTKTIWLSSTEKPGPGYLGWTEPFLCVHTPNQGFRTGCERNLQASIRWRSERGDSPQSHTCYKQAEGTWRDCVTTPVALL